MLSGKQQRYGPALKRDEPVHSRRVNPRGIGEWRCEQGGSSFSVRTVHLGNIGDRIAQTSKGRRRYVHRSFLVLRIKHLMAIHKATRSEDSARKAF